MKHPTAACPYIMGFYSYYDCQLDFLEVLFMSEEKFVYRGTLYLLQRILQEKIGKLFV